MLMNDRSTIEYNPQATGMKLERKGTAAPMTTWTFGPQMADGHGCSVKMLVMGFLMMKRILKHLPITGTLKKGLWPH